MRKWFAKLGLAFSSLLFVSLMVELGLRLGVDPGGPPMINLRHDRLGHVLQPNLDFEHLWDGRESRNHIHTNSLGMRQGELPATKDADEFRILMLGDSYTFGYGVDDEETFAALLESDLNDAGSPSALRTRVLNAGVPSYGTAHEMLQFEMSGRGLLADVVVLNVFLGNDVQDNLCLGYVSLEPHGRPPCFAVEGGALRELEVEPPAPAQVDEPRPVWRSVLGAIERAKAVEFASQQAGRALTSNAWLAKLLYAFGVEIDPGYSPHIVSGWYSPEYAVPGWELTRALLLRLRDDVVASGARFAIVLIPSRTQVLPGLFELSGVLYRESPDVQKFLADPNLPQRRLAELAAAEGIPLLDLQPVLAAHEPVDRLYFPVISHWNAEGHRVATHAIEEFLIGNGLTSPEPREREAPTTNPNG